MHLVKNLDKHNNSLFVLSDRKLISSGVHVKVECEICDLVNITKVLENLFISDFQLPTYFVVYFGEELTQSFKRQRIVF